MLQDVLAALPLGIFLAFLFGPVFFVLLETAAIKGFRAAFGPKNRAPQNEVVVHRALDRVFVCFEGVCLHMVLR